MRPRSGALSTLHFTLNGAYAESRAPADRRLTQILREDHGLTSARMACGIGRCGACMVLWNGRPVNACLIMAWQIDGAEIVTAEGLDAIAQARIVKAALAEENSFQCGYCAPGFVITLTALLREGGHVGEADIRRALEGNICRCTGYHSILRGALRAAEMLAEQSWIEQQANVERQSAIERQARIEQQANVERQSAIERQARIEQHAAIEPQAKIGLQATIEQQAKIEQRGEHR